MACARRSLTSAVIALTVAASLTALIVFPLSFLRSFAYAGIGVVGLAAVGAVVVLPAFLALIGIRVDKLTLLRAGRRWADSRGRSQRRQTRAKGGVLA